MTDLSSPARLDIRKALIVFNPTAGRRRHARLLALIDRLKRAGVQVEVAETRFAGDATVIARSAATRPPQTRPDVVVAAGGDGTINEVANGLAGSAMPLGIIPLGTANVLAIEIGQSLGLEAITRTLTHGQIKRIRLGLIEWDGGRRHFLIMAGIGFDAHVVAGVSPALKRKFGKLAYVAEMGRQMRRFPYPRYELTFTDGPTVEVSSAIFAKARHYGGRFIAAPAADMAAPKLDARLFRNGGAGAVLGYGLALGLNLLDRLPSVDLIETLDVAIDGPAGDPIQADGDLIAQLPARISLSSAVLDLLVPAP